MKLTVFNGSPRGKESNSTRMIPWITGDASQEILYLNRSSLYDSYLEKARETDAFLFVFPLYVDSMPGITKAFFELMEKNKSLFTGKPVYFVVHSGFPEMIQSRLLSRYNEYFAGKVMGMKYRGTVIIAGSESMQMAPDQAFRRIQGLLREAGNAMEEGRSLPEDLNMRINKRERLTGLQRFFYTLAPGPLKNFYWNYRAKKSGGKIDLKARPYSYPT